MKIKKKAAIAAAAVFTAAMSFRACDNLTSTVYGPPPEEWELTLTKPDTEIVNNDDTTQSEKENGHDTSEETEGDEQQ